MLCSECNKNPAILFYKKIEDGKESLEGYCYSCAKKKGINPAEVLSEQNNILGNDRPNINDMSKQFESIFKDLAENINLEDLENIEGAITFDNIDGKEDEMPSKHYKIAGKCCESGDVIIEDAFLPEVKPNDLLIVKTTGAYGYSMASHYNKALGLPVIFCKEGKSQCVIRRETYDDLIRLENDL